MARLRWGARVSGPFSQRCCCAPDGSCPTEQLVDELYGAEPPKTATASLQNAVVALRKALGPDVLVTRPPGYVARGHAGPDRRAALRAAARGCEDSGAGGAPGAPRAGARPLARAATGGVCVRGVGADRGTTPRGAAPGRRRGANRDRRRARSGRRSRARARVARRRAPAAGATLRAPDARTVRSRSPGGCAERLRLPPGRARRAWPGARRPGSSAPGVDSPSRRRARTRAERHGAGRGRGGREGARRRARRPGARVSTAVRISRRISRPRSDIRAIARWISRACRSTWRR